MFYYIMFLDWISSTICNIEVCVWNLIQVTELLKVIIDPSFLDSDANNSTTHLYHTVVQSSTLS